MAISNLYKTSFSIPTLGLLHAFSNGLALTGLAFPSQLDKNKDYNTYTSIAYQDLPVFASTYHWLVTYAKGLEPQFLPPLDYSSGTAFRKAVWSALLAIPYGQTRTYGQLAQQVYGQTPKGFMARAIGSAVGHNPIAIIIPCHRIIGADHSLTGYTGGITIKRQLLALEGSYPFSK